MSSKKISFQNSSGHTLSAKLELPDTRDAHNFAIFAHCFTCNKNLTAVRNISRALNNSGIGVLRFDFTGLGESEGDFSDTNFSSNVQDIIDAANFLAQEYTAPTILVGHSLGGAAVIFAGKVIDSIKAVATVGAPSSPAHVQHLFKSSLAEIESSGVAEVSIGGRAFTVKKDFIDDLEQKSAAMTVKHLRKPILIIHSPQDTTVGIENAKELYHEAKHPKSFISVDGADHLLSNRKDSNYVGNVIAGWVERYIEIPEFNAPKTKHQVAVSIGNRGYTSEITAGRHELIADEPESVGGRDFGPSPYEYVSSGLGACTVMTLRMYADRKQWDLQKVIVHIDHGKDYFEDHQDNGSSQKIDVFNREIEFIGNLDDKQIERLLQIADKCPVHKTLSSTSKINTILKV